MPISNPFANPFAIAKASKTDLHNNATQHAVNGIVISDAEKKTYRIGLLGVPSCCGAYFIISEDTIPVSILDALLRPFKMCGKMLIFFMPVLPTGVTKIAEGVGVTDWDDDHDKYTVATIVADKAKLPVGVTLMHELWVAQYGISHLMRCTEDVFFFHALGTLDNLSKIQKELAKADKKSTLLYIANGLQHSRKEVLQTGHVFKCKNAGTGNTLYLFCKEITPKSDSHTMVDAAPKQP